MRNKGRWIVGGMLIGGLIAGGVWWRSSHAASDEAAATETAVVERGTLRETAGGTGSVVAHEDVALSFATSGTVAEVLVAPGELVSAGQPLAVLDTADLTLAVSAAEADLDAARGNLTSAQLSLDALQAGADATELEQARLAVDRAKNQLWGVQVQRDSTCGAYERWKGLSDEEQERSPSSGQASCDGAQASVQSAEVGVRSAELEYEAVLAGADAAEIAASRAKVASARAQVSSSEIRVAQARADLEAATLTSPITGTVMAMDLSVGAAAGTGQAALVADLSRLDVLINLDETDVASVAVGQAATVTLDAFEDDTLAGEVAAISPTATTQSGVVLYPVTVSFDRGELAVRPGMTAEVEITVQAVEDTLIVPLRAVVSRPDGTYVVRVSVADGASSSSAGVGDGSAGASDAAPGSIRAGGPAPGFQGTPGSMGARPVGTPPAGWAGGATGDRATRRASALASQAASGRETVPVTLGMTTATQAEIKSGLNEGDVVVVNATASSSSEVLFGGGGPPGMRGGMDVGGAFRGEP